MNRFILLIGCLLFSFFSAFSQEGFDFTRDRFRMRERGKHRIIMDSLGFEGVPTGKRWTGLLPKIGSEHQLRIGKKEIPIHISNEQRPDEKQLSTIKNVLTEDFLVNDDTTGGYVGKYSPCIAMDGNGNFVIVWEDCRNSDRDIYFQRYDSSGIAQCVNTKANDDVGITGQGSPSIGMDGFGNFMIVWQDYRNGNYDVYFQRFNSSGITQGKNAKVNNDVGMADQLNPAVAMDGDGNFVVVWEDCRNGDTDIYFQQYDSIGVTKGVNTKVNSDLGIAWQQTPSISMDRSGNFIIVWMDYRNGDWDIFYQRYNSSGVVQGVNTKVNDDALPAVQLYPSIAVHGSGNFVIVWMDNRSGDWEIYLQKYSSNGTVHGVNEKVNDDNGRAAQMPSISIDGNGHFVIVWEDWRNGSSDVYLQRYDSSGVYQGVNTMVHDDVGLVYQGSPSVSMDGSGALIVVWIDWRNDNNDIYYQRYGSNGNTNGENTKVNDDIGTAQQESPFISMDGSGNFTVVWEDWCYGNRDIYLQRYNSSGAIQGVNVKVNDDLGMAYQFTPSISMDGSGNYVVVWEDRRNGNRDIYLQRYNSSGVSQGVNTKVNDDIGEATQNYPSIAMDGSGNFVVAWMDFRNGDWDIYYQRYDANGVVQGTNIKVNDDAIPAVQSYPSISIEGNGSFIIVWCDERNGSGVSDIYCQRYNSSGVAQGVNVKVNNDFGEGKSSPSVTMDEFGNFIIVWEDYRHGFYNPDIIGQRYHVNGTTWGTNYRIVADGPNHGECYPVVAANASQIVFSWKDNRRSKGWDIYAKVVDWDWDGETSVLSEKIIPIEFALLQNYPNPFNPKTSFKFQISNPKFITLKLYDIFGREVATLVNDQKEAGEYTVSWDASGYPSGVYYYRLQTIDPSTSSRQILIETKKCVLIR